MPHVTIQHASAVGALGVCGDVFASVMHLPPTLAFLHEVRRAAGVHHRRFGAANRGFSVLESTSLAANTPAAVREDATKIAADYPAAAASVVVEGSGFGTAAARVVIAGMHLVRYGSSPQRYEIVSTAPDAARWLFSLAPPAGAEVLDEKTLLAALTQVRGAITAVPSAPSSVNRKQTSLLSPTGSATQRSRTAPRSRISASASRR